ncbi:MAG: quinolinate synthase NadA [Candidatus Alcyoniella australis]|nr:quinolinate synthase NadA [Candidatus Alcyoniella australis]
MDEAKTIERIRELAREKNVLLLAHNYQRPEVQDLADHVGDSLGLSIIATQTDAELIVFCGVHFMAQSAAILAPDRTVLLPRMEAGCPMADMIDAEQLIEFKAEHPGAAVVTYVNSTAEVKALSDICCTSANAQRVVQSLDADEVLFVPDRNLAAWVARHVDKRVIPWHGFCVTHELLTADDVRLAREQHPAALVMAHPECRAEVLDLAHEVRSTSGMLEVAQHSEAQEFIVCTEIDMLHRLRLDNPHKRFFPASLNMVCSNMKLTTLRDVQAALCDPPSFTVEVAADVREPAKRALDRMLATPRDA